MKVTKKTAYIIAGVSLVGLGALAYFLFKPEKGSYIQEEAEKTPDNSPSFRQELKQYRNSKEVKELCRSLLLVMNKTGMINKEQVKELINQVPSDYHMKEFKEYFACHLYQGSMFSQNRRLDLAGWLEESLSSDDFNSILKKYPTLNYRIICK